MRRIVSKIVNKSEIWFDSFHNLNVIIGRANQGPSLTPIFVSDPSQLSNVYLVFGKDSDLYNAAWEAYDGIGNYCFIKLNGRHREIRFDDLFKAISIGCESIYNTYNVSISEVDGVKYFCVYNADLSLCCRYALDDLSLGGLASKMTADAELGVCPFYGETGSLFQDVSADILSQYFDDSSGKRKQPTSIAADPQDDSAMDFNLQDCVYDLAAYHTLNISILNYRYDHMLKRNIALDGFSKVDIATSPYAESLYKINLFEGDKVDIGTTYYLEGLTNLAVTPVFVEGNTALLKKIGDDFDEELFLSLQKINMICDMDYITLYEFLSEISIEKTSFDVPTFFNLGVPHDKVDKSGIGEYNKFLAFYESLTDGALNPFINIIIDSFKTSLYSESNNAYFSNGVALVTRAINNIQDFNNITGFVVSGFREYNDIVTEQEKLSLNQLGVLTTNIRKDGTAVISNGGNLLRSQNKIMSDVSNSYLIRDIIQSISRQLTAESSSGEIRTTIDTLISENYSEVIRDYKLEIESNVEKKEINRAVRLDLYIAGFIKGLQTVIYLG